GHLARILDPGSEITDFGYDSSGRLTQIRDPLTNDLIASGAIADPTADTHKTLIAYDAAGKATKVTAPVPDSTGAARPEHTYSYVASNKTNVSVAGLTPATGYARQVTMDASNRLIEDRDSAGKLTSHTWDSQDRPTSSTDPAGLKTTTVYDSAGRPTDSYGPAAASEFGADLRSTTAPHSTTAYDEGIDGMAAAWWDNTSIAGPPKAHTTLSNWTDWGSGSPSAQLTADSFSGRLTGEINAPTAGSYGFSTDVATDDGVRLFVDDKAVVERWDTHRGSVSKESPLAYWRLGEASGTTAADYTSAHRDATYVNGVGLGQTGAIEGSADTSAYFDGVNDYVISPALSPTSQSVSLELWFKPEAAGVIVSELGQSTPNTAWHDAQLEITPSGQVLGSVWILPPVSLGTASFGSWHHAVVRYDHTTQMLDGYLDGVRSATFSTGDRMAPWESGYTLRYAFGAADSSHRGSGGAAFKGWIDEAAVYEKPVADDRIIAHYKAGKLSGQTSLTAGAHRLRIDYKDPGSDAKLALNWTPPGGSQVQLPIASVKPRYGLETSQVDSDGKKTATEYASPEIGLATASAVDPAGLNLRSTTTYESPGTGYFRRIARTLPKGASSQVTYSWFGPTETADNPCTTATESINQAGQMKSTTAADPDGAGPADPIVRQYRYDPQGRPVAERVATDANWTCTTYDSRGRVVTQKDSSGKTTSMDFSVPDKVTTSYKDSSGTDRTTVAKTDWLGRALSYTDENASITRNVYDQAARVTATYRSLFGGPESQLSATAYDSATARLASVTEFASGTARATTFSYDSAGRLDSTTRPNGVITKDTYHSSRGWLSDISHKKNSTELSAWSYARNPSGDISQETGAGRTRAFTYDNAGRLTKTVQTATAPATRNYSYDQNTNRCSTATTCDASYSSYDSADRLVSSPFASSYTYDSHGNLTTADLTKPATAVTSSINGNAAAGATSSHTVAASAAGTISASVDWQQDTAAKTDNSSVGALEEGSHPISVSANGAISATLTWPSAVPNANLDLYLYDSTGAEVASSKQLTGNSESVTFDVTGVGAYPDAKSFTLKVKALG
ncbi:MAG: PA14 domain-containing protein, partial [Actinomycetota bacterium]